MRRWLLTLCLLCVPAAVLLAAEEPLAYPPTKRVVTSVAVGGGSWTDAYVWLEDDAHEEVVAWDHAQLELLRQRLDPDPRLGELRAALAAEFAFGGMRSLPVFSSGMRWSTHRPKGRAQAVLYRADAAATKPPQVILDPNRWSGARKLRGWSVSPDGRFLAYLEHDTQRAVRTLRLRDLNARNTVPEFIERVPDAAITWLEDSSGFFYVRLPDPGSVPPGEAARHPRLYLHRMGTLVLDDPLVYGRGRPRDETFGLRRASDGRTLLLWREAPTTSTELFEARWQDEALALRPLALPPVAEPSKEGEAAPAAGAPERARVDRVGGTYVLTSDRGDGRRAVYTAKADAEGALVDLAEVPFPRGKGGQVREVRIVGGTTLVAHVRDDLVSSLHARALAGGPVRSVPLPGAGSVGDGMTLEEGTGALWFVFESHARPPTRYRVDLAADTLAPEERGSLPTTVAPDALTTRRLSFESADGTRIPVTLLHRRDVTPDGTQPLILTGYGALGRGRFPHYDRALALWADLGGVVADACLRGGDEFGTAWREAGRGLHKVNAVLDLIAVADGLVQAKVASRARLALVADDHGATVAAAALNRRPDLCRAAVLHAPLADLVRFPAYRGGAAWVAEYGDPTDARDARARTALAAISPYHTLRPAEAYPAVLVTAALDDEGIAALHARKLAAYWQWGSISVLPILLRLERPHPQTGRYGPLRHVARLTDAWTFLRMELGDAAAR